MGGSPQWEEFNNVVCTIVDEYTLGFGADTYHGTDEVLKHSKLFMRDALTFWVFSDAIRHEEVGLMWLIYTFWLFMFRGAGCHNYGNEILEMVAQYQYEMPATLRRIVERTWLVNRWEKLYPFHENAADLFPRKVQHQDGSTQPNNALLRTKRHRLKPPPNLRTPVTMDGLDPEHFPDQISRFTEDMTTFLECLNEFPEFTDEVVTASILAFQGDLKVGLNLPPGPVSLTVVVT